MITINISSKFVLVFLLVGLLLGFGAGLVLDGREKTVQAQTPDNENEGEETERPNQSQTAFYHRASGLSFYPLYHDWEYTQTLANGCLYRENGSGTNPYYYAYDLKLPHGAEITTFNVYYYDTSPQDLEVELRAYDGAGSETLIEDGSSTGTQGYGVTQSGVFSHIVNNIAESLAMIVRISTDTDNALRFCGVRITYEFDISSNYLPAMLNLSAP